MTLPALGESVTEGTVSRWLKQVGETVEADEALLEVSTDKVDTEIPSPTSGTLLEIRVQEDETVEVGAVLAVIGEAGAEAPSRTRARARAEARTQRPEPRAGARRPPRSAPPSYSDADRSRLPEAGPGWPKDDAQPEQHGPAQSSAPAPRPVATDSDAGYVTPLVRKLAKEHGVDLASVKGTGVGGRVRKQDVLAGGRGGQAGRRPLRRRQPARQLAAAASRAGGTGRAQQPARARPRRCPGCARPSPSGWSSRCRCRPS